MHPPRRGTKTPRSGRRPNRLDRQCPVGDQAERGRSYARLVEGALRHPLFVGCHWFQYRDQPLVGRGDGEAYQCGFVDGCDRPYRELCDAARAVGEKMYEERSGPPASAGRND